MREKTQEVETDIQPAAPESYPPVETSEAFPDGYQYHSPEEVNGNG